MKTLIPLLLLLPFICFGQTPQGINYQAVAYDANGFELANQEISVRLGILLETADAESSYTETHQVSTNDFGLFSLVISEGNSTDDFSTLNWENGAFLKVELDANLDGDYTLMGINSFSSVPYSLFAENVNNEDELQTISIINDSLSISNGNSIKISDLLAESVSDISQISLSNKSLIFPDGCFGESFTINLSDGDFTVPSGKNFYITNNHTTLSNGVCKINGIDITYGQSNFANYTELKLPVIAGGNDIISGTNNINGFIVESSVIPFTIDLSSEEFNVPNGYNFYITNAFSNVSNSELKINGIKIIQGQSNFENYTELQIPLLLKSGDLVSGSHNINGYLAPINFFNQSILYTNGVSSFGLPINISMDSINYENNGVVVLNATTLPSAGSGITEKGFCWSTSNELPTVYDEYVSLGSGSGSYTHEYIPLEDSVTYFVRAFVTSTEGMTYSEVHSFTTELVFGMEYAGGLIITLDGAGGGDVILNQSFNTWPESSSVNESNCSIRNETVSQLNIESYNGFSDWGFGENTNQLLDFYKTYHSLKLSGVLLPSTSNSPLLGYCNSGYVYYLAQCPGIGSTWSYSSGSIPCPSEYWSTTSTYYLIFRSF